MGDPTFPAVEPRQRIDAILRVPGPGVGDRPGPVRPARPGRQRPPPARRGPACADAPDVRGFERPDDRMCGRCRLDRPRGGDDGGVALDTAPGAPLTDPALVAALRDDLAAAGYGVAGVEEVLGAVAADALHREEPVPALRATEAAADDVVAALVRTFLLGVDRRRGGCSSGRCPTLTVDGAERLGLVETDGDQVRARVDLRPYTAVDGGGEVDWWIASDLGELATGQALRTDHVLGVGGASTTLAQVTVRDDARPRARPRHGLRDPGAARVAALAPGGRHRHLAAGARVRAVQRGARRAWTLDLREGSMLEPVADERFDLVVSNPPFVITPRTPGMPSYEYRDGGRSGRRDRARARRGRRRGAGARRRGAAAGQLGGAARRAVARARRLLARRQRAGRVGGPARAAGPRAVRRDVDPRRRHDARPRPRRVGRPVRAVAGRLRVAGRRGHRVRLRDPAQAARRADAAPAGGGHRDGPAAARAGDRRLASPRTTGSR